MEDKLIFSRLIIKALYKPKLYMGCEKVPWLIVAGLSAIAAYVAQTWLTRGIAIFMGFGLIGIIAYINSKEPYFFAIWYRYLKYQKFYLNVAIHPGRNHKPSNK